MLAAPQDIHTHPEWPFRAAEEPWAALLPGTPLQGQGKQLERAQQLLAVAQRELQSG